VTFTKLFSFSRSHLHLTEVRLLSPGTILSKLEKLTEQTKTCCVFTQRSRKNNIAIKLEKESLKEKEGELAIGICCRSVIAKMPKMHSVK
jgi:hypothetical protein